MKLIVGLGNPGEQYKQTRHNVGFEFLDSIANHYKIKIDKLKFNGLYTNLKINDEQIILLKPQRYMNLSGEVIKKYIDYFKIEIKDLLIIHDDFDLPCGKIRMRLKGSSGGHNGLKDIEQNLKTTEYKRIKLGIGENKDSEIKKEAINFVLGKFNNDDLKIMNSVYESAPNIIKDYINLTFENLMNKYN